MGRVLVTVLALVVVVVVVLVTVMLLGRPATSPSRVGQAMPDFELDDLQGHTWRRADLEGKTAFVNVWATWCKPCCQELPHVRRLYERVKDRPDVVLLTMNVDEKQSEAQPFMAKNGYTFPVAPAYDYVRKTLATVGIPRNWVLDANGVWRFDEVGYRNGADDWVANAERMIEETRTVHGAPQPKSTAAGS